MFQSLSYLTDREKRKRLLEFIKVTASHHPHCKYYSNHVFVLRGVKLCKGCSIYYPTSFVSLLLIWILPAYLFKADPILLIGVGVLLASPSLLHLIKFDRILGIERSFSIFSRFLLGLGFGYFIRLLVSIPLLYKIIAFSGVLFLFLVINGVRFLTFWKECQPCPFNNERKEMGNCPGLNPINLVLNRSVVAELETK